MDLLRSFLPHLVLLYFHFHSSFLSSLILSFIPTTEAWSHLQMFLLSLIEFLCKNFKLESFLKYNRYEIKRRIGWNRNSKGFVRNIWHINQEIIDNFLNFVKSSFISPCGKLYNSQIVCINSPLGSPQNWLQHNAGNPKCEVYRSVFTLPWETVRATNRITISN